MNRSYSWGGNQITPRPVFVYDPPRCRSCWRNAYRVGPYWICRNLRCDQLVVI